MQTSLESAISAQTAVRRPRKAPPTSPSMGRFSAMRMHCGLGKRPQQGTHVRRRERAWSLAKPQRAAPAKQLPRLATVTEPTLEAHRMELTQLEQRAPGEGRLLGAKTVDWLMRGSFAEKCLAGWGPALERHLRSAWAWLKTRSYVVVAQHDGHYDVVAQHDGYWRPSEAPNLVKVSIVPPQPCTNQLYSGEWSFVMGDPELEMTTKTGLKDAGIGISEADRRLLGGLLRRRYDRGHPPHGHIFRVSLPQCDGLSSRASRSSVSTGSRGAGLRWPTANLGKLFKMSGAQRALAPSRGHRCPSWLRQGHTYGDKVW
ncbi:unnamed protein product [Prorocentrum cordatum]|uniref:Uncharacterized protein n=1 Tax=Prorocentrum cordatum TaxID=2364126 RepID=A0ABN9RMP4_9DINO|nr:unnamed protein product [Polarella glacialis]